MLDGIKEDKDKCFAEFTDEVPNDVKVERQSRMGKGKMSLDSLSTRRSSDRGSPKRGGSPKSKKKGDSSPTSKSKGDSSPFDKVTVDFDPSKEGMDTHEMLAINCQFKKPIKKLLMDLERAKLAKAALEDKHSALKESLSKIKKSTPAYKAVKGDKVDELFAKHLNASGL